MQTRTLSRNTRVSNYCELEKLCAKCEEWWPADEEFFNRDKNSKDGLHSYCKSCLAEYRYEKGHKTRQALGKNFIDPFRRLLFDDDTEYTGSVLWKQCDLRL